MVVKLSVNAANSLYTRRKVKMNITIAPFEVDNNWHDRASRFGYEMDQNLENDDLPITYWGVYWDDKYISYTSSKELAEETKSWMEKWLSDRL